MDFPEVESVMGFTSTGIGSAECAKRGIHYEVEDFGMGIIRLKNGSCIHLEASYFHNQSDMNTQEFFLSGSKGIVKGDEIFSIEEGEQQAIPLIPDHQAPKSCVEHFIRVIQGQEPLSSTCEQALTGLKIIEAIYESSQSGRPITFS